MTTRLGAAVALSALAHGGALATVGALGALWLAAVPPAPAPALYVDLVEPVVATNERIVASAAPTSRARRLDHAPGSSVIAPAAPPMPVDARPEPDTIARDAEEPAARPPIVTPEIPGPPVAPKAPASPPAPVPMVVLGIAPEPPAPVPAVPSAAAPALEPSETIAGSSAPARSSPASPPSPRRASDEEHGSPIASLSGRGTAGGSANPSGAASTVEAPGSGARSHDDSGTGGLARFAPGGAPSSVARDGSVPPEYEAYVRALRQRVQDRLVYPWAAVRRGQQGIVELEVRVGAEGALVGVEVVAGPRAETLRTAAVTAVRSAAPFPFPSGVEGRPLVIRLPVEFQLR